MLAQLLSQLCPQCIVQALPGAVFAPLPKVVLDAFPLGVLTRQHPPLDAANHHIQNGVEDQTHVQFSGSPTYFGWWNMFFEMLPLTVRQIAGIELVEFAAHTIQPTVATGEPALQHFSDRFLGLSRPI